MAGSTVNYLPDMDTMWVLKVSPAVDEPFDGPMHVIEAVFNAFEDLMIPTEIEYVAFAASNAEDLLTEGKGYGETEQVVSDYFEKQDGITFPEFQKELRGKMDPKRPYRAITRVTIHHCRTRLILDGDMVAVSTEYDGYQVSDSIPVEDFSPSDDPIRISIYTRGEGPESPFEIVVRTYTDSWFEDSEEGSINRQRLGTAFDRLRESLDVVATEVDSVKYPESVLKDRGYTELIP